MRAPDFTEELLIIIDAEFKERQAASAGLSPGELAIGLKEAARSRLQSMLEILDSPAFQPRLDRSARFFAKRK
jgi:hypothetical protein